VIEEEAFHGAVGIDHQRVHLGVSHVTRRGIDHARQRVVGDHPLAHAERIDVQDRNTIGVDPPCETEGAQRQDRCDVCGKPGERGLRRKLEHSKFAQSLTQTVQRRFCGVLCRNGAGLSAAAHLFI
jgi:hypothetical protein